MCSVEGCYINKIFARGWCAKHYQQVRRHGKIFEQTKADFNKIEDKGKYYELILTDAYLNEIGRAKIDKDDLEKVKNVGRWTLKTDGYVYNRNTTQYLHRTIMNAKKDEEVDHIKTGKKNKSDCRKSKLRLCNHEQNMFNQPKRRDNTSGYKGVCWNKEKGKWQASISVKGKTRFLGYFSDIKKAKIAYDNAACKLHKEYYNKGE